MMMVTKRVEFCAAHKLALMNYDEKKNYEIFGKCSKGRGHGHNYVLDVTIGGKIDPITGMVYDMKALKRLLNTEIVDKLDHRDLNDSEGFLQGQVPTTENLAVAIWKALEEKVNPMKLIEVKIWETANNSVTYRGE